MKFHRRGAPPKQPQTENINFDMFPESVWSIGIGKLKCQKRIESSSPSRIRNQQHLKNLTKDVGKVRLKIMGRIYRGKAASLRGVIMIIYCTNFSRERNKSPLNHITYTRVDANWLNIIFYAEEIWSFSARNTMLVFFNGSAGDSCGGVFGVWRLCSCS